MSGTLRKKEFSLDGAFHLDGGDLGVAATGGQSVEITVDT